MRILIFNILIVLFLFSKVTAQNAAFKPIADADMPACMEKIRNASASLTSLQCSFTQNKNIAVLSESVISKGILLYKKGNKLCWEYASPYYYLFALNGDKVYIKNDNSTRQFDTKSNALFKEISLLLMNSISGSELIDKKKFDVAFFESSTRVQVKLTPKNKTMKSVLNTIILYFEKSTYMVSTIEMIEPAGDTTTIVFNEIKINPPISNERFVVTL
ncbi:MAG TPA: outer membrane lipoprotein carrier protein LolA [Bacteroidales bacterium]|nr:outer membrane lipoprotein carrier protein LolA [Bacteroidales bacterium]HPT21382.1 outer membrane lipoprotein carrier protein LolA [Bacteroidales bacterium]